MPGDDSTDNFGPRPKKRFRMDPLGGSAGSGADGGNGDGNSGGGNRLRKINYPKKRVNVACDICRSRKTRCDAAKPKCAFCKEVGAECSYRGKPPGSDYVPGLESARVGDTPEKEEPDRDPDPEPTAGTSTNPVYESEIISSLRRIEGLLRQPSRSAHDVEQPPPVPQQAIYPTPDVLHDDHTPGSNASPTDERERYESLAKSTIGLDLSGLSRLTDQQILPELLPFCTDAEDGENELEVELFQGQSIFDGPPISLNDLVVNPRRCWQLEQHFSRDVLPWFPIIDQQVSTEIVSRAVEGGFGYTTSDTRLALFILAVGSFAQDCHHTADDPPSFPGHDYFRAGYQLLDADRAKNATVEHVQCHILASFYLLLALRPIQAFHAIRRASEMVILLLRLRRRLDADRTTRELVHRAYWACYVIEHELQAYVPDSARALQDFHEAVPLPMSSYDEPGIYWFTAEIALRRIFARPRYGVGWNLVHTIYEPAVAEEVALQLDEWHANLPGPITFNLGAPDGSTSSLPPLLDPRKIFLRGQYYALQAFICWPNVVRLLAAPGTTPTTAAVEAAARSIRFAVLHVYAVEPMFQQRGPMLLANVVGMYAMTLTLVSTYGLPRLEELGISHPCAADASRVGWLAMKKWEANLSMASKANKVERLMRSKGIPLS